MFFANAQDLDYAFVDIDIIKDAEAVPRAETDLPARAKGSGFSQLLAVFCRNFRARLLEENMKEYTVLYEQGKRNWSAYVPDLPGCIATGKTRKAVERQIREAIGFHLEGMQARGEKIPEPSIEAGTVVVGAKETRIRLHNPCAAV